MINWYIKNQVILSEVINWLTLYIISLTGIITRNVFDDKVNLSLSQTMTGSLFISLIIYFFGSGIENKKLVNGITLMSGFGSKDLIRRWIDIKIWDKTTIIK